MHLSLTGLALWALAAAQTAEAHYRFSKLLVNGQLPNDFEYIRENSNGIMPTKQFLQASDDFRCNSGSFANAGRTKIAKVNPGDTIGFQLWCYATMQHPGPLTIHMSKAPGDVRQYRGDGDWFKVHQMIICKPPTGGYLDDKDWCTWAPVKETVDLSRSGDTEFYYECAQIEVTGNGNGRPGPTVKIPGLYDSNDPALRFWMDSFSEPSTTDLEMEGFRKPLVSALEDIAHAESSPETFTVIEGFTDPTIGSRIWTKSVPRDRVLSGSWMEEPVTGPSDSAQATVCHTLRMLFVERSGTGYIPEITREDMAAAIDVCQIDHAVGYYLGKPSWWGFVPIGIRREKGQFSFIIRLWGMLTCLWSYDFRSSSTKAIFVSNPEDTKAVESLCFQHRDVLAHPLFLAFVFARHALGNLFIDLDEQRYLRKAMEHQIRAKIGSGKRTPGESEKSTTKLTGIIGSASFDTVGFNQYLELVGQVFDASTTDSLGLREYYLEGNERLPNSLAASVWEDLAEAAMFLRPDLRHLLDTNNVMETWTNVSLNIIWNIVAKEDAEASRALAAATRRDSESMKTLAIVTMAFLPATFFATLFSMPVFDWESSPVVQDGFRVYLAWALPSSALVFALWAATTRTQRAAILEAVAAVKSVRVKERLEALRDRLNTGKLDVDDKTGPSGSVV
ncbi:hypothetical protein OQA88_8085 [Cercophora sp. LCS_1]